MEEEEAYRTCKQLYSKEVVNGEHPNTHGDCAGLIFMCNESTKMDCFKYGVFGLSAKKKNLMGMITKGMCLFLFDVNLKVMHGIYAASSCGEFNLEPDAFGGDFPWQVKFHIEKDCLPLPEDVFKAAIKDNYFSSRRFNGELTTEQVQKLVKLFSPFLVQVPSITEPRSHHTLNIEACKQIPEGHPTSALPLKTSCNVRHEVIRGDPPPSIQNTPTHLLSDRVFSQDCKHDQHSLSRPLHQFSPCMTTCKAHQMLHTVTDGHQANHGPVHTFEDATTETCSHGHAVEVQHEHICNHIQQGLRKRNVNFIHNECVNNCCVNGFFAPQVQERHSCVADKACSMVEECPAFWNRHLLGSSPASLGSIQGHLVPSLKQKTPCHGNFHNNPIANTLSACFCASLPKASLAATLPGQKTLCHGNFHNDPFANTLSACFCASLPKASLAATLPGPVCKAVGHKRPIHEVVHVQSEAQGNALNAIGERPIKHLYRLVLE